jgi:glutamate dehydrogenase
MSSSKSSSHEWLKDVELIDSKEEPVSVDASVSLENVLRGMGESPLRNELMEGVFKELKKELEIVVPWFLSQMPPLYHFITPVAQKIDTIMEIVAGKVLTEEQMVERVDTKDERVTIIAPGAAGTSIVKIAPRLGKYTGKVITMVSSVDTKLAVCHIHQRPYSTASNWTSPGQQKKRAAAKALLTGKPEGEVDAYLDSLDADYAREATIRMIALGFEAVEYCNDNENSYVNLTTVEDDPIENRFRVDIGVKGFPITAAAENIVGIFNRYNFVVRRVLGQDVRMADGQQFTIVSVIASSATGERVNADGTAWGRSRASSRSVTLTMATSSRPCCRETTRAA